MAAAPLPTSGVAARRTPWDVLDLHKPQADSDIVIADVRQAFRGMAKRMHPDTGGTKEDFMLLMWAYHEVITRGLNAGNDKAGVTCSEDDDFLSEFQRATRVIVPGYGSLINVEAETDDDGWMGREALSDFYVTQHDGLNADAVQENDLAIYRLLHPIWGRSWGVGQVVAVQATFSKRNTPPGGRIFLYALKLADGRLEKTSNLYLVPDDCAETATCRVVDRFALLRNGVTRTEEGYVIETGSNSHKRLVSGRVHIAQCEFEDECEMKAEECIYCYDGQECYVEY